MPKLEADPSYVFMFDADCEEYRHFRKSFPCAIVSHNNVDDHDRKGVDDRKGLISRVGEKLFHLKVSRSPSKTKPLLKLPRSLSKTKQMSCMKDQRFFSPQLKKKRPIKDPGVSSLGLKEKRPLPREIIIHRRDLGISYSRPVTEEMRATMDLGFYDGSRPLDEEDVDAVWNVVKQIDLPGAMKRKEDLDDFIFGEAEDMKIKSHSYATAALSYLLKKGQNLELVKPCMYEARLIGFGCSVGLSAHFNFKAKKADDPSAPVEMYFGQLRDYEDLHVECCVSLGDSDSLPYERDNRGCKYCTIFVHHPVGGCDGIKLG